MEEEVYLSVSFTRIGKSKAREIVNLVAQIAGEEAADMNVHFDTPFYPEDDDDSE